MIDLRRVCRAAPRQCLTLGTLSAVPGARKERRTAQTIRGAAHHDACQSLAKTPHQSQPAPPPSRGCTPPTRPRSGAAGCPDLEQARDALGLPANLVAEIDGRLRSQRKLLGQIVAVLCPPRCGGRTHPARWRGRGGDKNLPARLRAALPKRSWLQRLRRVGLEVLLPL